MEMPNASSTGVSFLSKLTNHTAHERETHDPVTGMDEDITGTPALEEGVNAYKREGEKQPT